MFMTRKRFIQMTVMMCCFLFFSGCATKITPPPPKSTETGLLNDSNAVQQIEWVDSKEEPPLGEVADTSTTIINSLDNKNSMEQFDKTKQYIAQVQTTAGDFVISFNVGQTPITVENFLTLASKGFYDNTIFHRVMEGFMIQGGDPLGNGTGGPGYKFDDEPFTGEYTRGTVAMANAGPNTNGSQFFIMHKDYPLPKNYVIFGKVVSGMETVDKIAKSPVGVNPSGESSAPLSPVKITKIIISVK